MDSRLWKTCTVSIKDLITIETEVQQNNNVSFLNSEAPANYYFYIIALLLILLISIFIFWRKLGSINPSKKTLTTQDNETKFLKEQIKIKTIELANTAQEIKKYDSLLSQIKEIIHEIETNPPVLKNRITKMKRLIDNQMEKNDKTFEIQMDELHQQFIKNLKTKHPKLSVNDLRLCVYLKLGLASGEIAEIIRVLPSSVYISRSRLRKKMNLDKEINLYEYLNDINPE
jgi:ABC-type nickel/cobalt efflux system permease component RcnA